MEELPAVSFCGSQLTLSRTIWARLMPPRLGFEFVAILTRYARLTPPLSATSDFLVPSTQDLSLNDTPDLDETDAKWTGKAFMDGT